MIKALALSLMDMARKDRPSFETRTILINIIAKLARHTFQLVQIFENVIWNSRWGRNRLKGTRCQWYKTLLSRLLYRMRTENNQQEYLQHSLQMPKHLEILLLLLKDRIIRSLQ